MGREREDSYQLFQPEIYLLNELYKYDCNIGYRIPHDEADLLLYNPNNDMSLIEIRVVDWDYTSKNGKSIIDPESFRFNIFLLDEHRNLINREENKNIINEFNVIAFEKYDLNTVIDIVIKHKYLDRNIVEKDKYESLKSEIDKLNFSSEEKENILNICYRRSFIDGCNIIPSKTQILYKEDFTDKPLISCIVDQAVKYDIDKKIYILKTDEEYISPRLVSDKEAKNYKINKDKILFYTSFYKEVDMGS